MPSLSGRSGPTLALRALVMALWRAWTLTLHAVGMVALWQQRARERRHLAGLGEHLLKDLGIDPGAAARECAKPFWRP